MIGLNGVFLEGFPKGLQYLTLSVSKAKTFKQCKAKYHFSFIQKLPKKEMDFHLFGKFLHEVLERFEKEIINGSNLNDNIILKNVYKQTLDVWVVKRKSDKSTKDKLQLTDKQLKECFDILCNYLYYRSELKKEGKLPTPICAEKPFYINVKDKVLINGYIDLVKLDVDGVLHVADYKTSASSEYLEKDFFQLKTYAYVMCLEDPNLEMVRCSYIMLRDNFRPVIVEYKREELIEVENKFIEYADSINKEKLFRPNTSILCGYCDFLDKCEAGRKKVDDIKKFGEIQW
jgi:CRISPR/Cas system-associated exonuclease Cas4 (RecB family)